MWAPAVWPRLGSGGGREGLAAWLPACLPSFSSAAAWLLPGAPPTCTRVCPDPAGTAGDKYVVRLVEDTDSMMEELQMGGPSGTADGTAPEPRVQFEILPAAAAQPAPVLGWQRVAAGVLLLLTLGSTLQFGLAANIGLLPKVRGRRPCVCV